jgi:hypothetical protein
MQSIINATGKIIESEERRKIGNLHLISPENRFFQQMFLVNLQFSPTFAPRKGYI